MKDKAKSFFTGLRAAFTIYPSTNYSDFVPKQTASERIHESWAKTGDQLRSAMATYKND